MILKQRQVLVDGRARTDLTFPAGFMDVVSIPKTDENFRLLYDTKVRVVLCSSVFCLHVRKKSPPPLLLLL